MPIKLEIIRQDDGSITLNGPLGDKVLMLGLLEYTKALVLDMKPQEIKPKPDLLVPDLQVVPPNGKRN